MKIMKRSMTLTYEVGSGLYVNITNKCPCACTFCIRNNGDGAYGSDPLWLEHQPSAEEIIDDLKKRDLEKYSEVVFCGYGEPTCELDVMLKVADYIKSKDKAEHKRPWQHHKRQEHRGGARWQA